MSAPYNVSFISLFSFIILQSSFTCSYIFLTKVLSNIPRALISSMVIVHVSDPQISMGSYESNLQLLAVNQQPRDSISIPDKGNRFSILQEVQTGYPCTGLNRPRRFQELEAFRFQDNRHMKVVRLSALRTGRLYPQGNIPGTHFC